MILKDQITSYFLRLHWNFVTSASYSVFCPTIIWKERFLGNSIFLRCQESWWTSPFVISFLPSLIDHMFNFSLLCGSMVILQTRVPLSAKMFEFASRNNFSEVRTYAYLGMVEGVGTHPYPVILYDHRNLCFWRGLIQVLACQSPANKKSLQRVILTANNSIPGQSPSLQPIQLRKK